MTSELQTSACSIRLLGHALIAKRIDWFMRSPIPLDVFGQSALTSTRQCELLGLSRAPPYYHPAEVSGHELELMRSSA